MVANEDTPEVSLVAKMQQKRDQLLKELDEVQGWLNQWDTYIARAKSIIGEKSSTSIDIPQKEPVRIIRFTGEKRNWEKIKLILKESERPMTVPEIYTAFVNRNWRIHGKNPKTVIRNSLLGKSDIFEKIDKSWQLKLSTA